MQVLTGAEGMPGHERNTQEVDALECPQKPVFSETEHPQWYVLRVHRKIELAEKLLLSEGTHYYIPKYYSIRVYHGKKYRCLVPLIPN